MQYNLINSDLVEKKMKDAAIDKMEDASIRDIVKVANLLSKECGVEFIRMEMGVPGLPPSKIGTEAEIESLKNNAAQFYPMLEGLPELRQEASKFIKNFMDIDVSQDHIVPTVGSMQACYVAFMAVTELYKERDTILFIDPGFSVQKTQMEVIGKPYEHFDLYNYRGEKLREKLEEYLEKGNICAILYSNPNNPCWVCFTEEELKIIGDLANKYDVIILEDLAYFGMDFRQDLSRPGEPPYQLTVGKYTDNYILFISSSKLFSYAGQRLGLLCVSDKLYHKKYPHLMERFHSEELGYTLVYKLIYTLTSGTAHSPQYAMAAILKAANDGRLNILEEVKEYEKRAVIMKKLFLDNGFYILYDKDGEENISDGFYFTIAYPGFKAGELARELLCYGICAIPLKTFGSMEEGLRACVSQTGMEKMDILKERLEKFAQDHPVGK